jgi:hypothetical protein
MKHKFKSSLLVFVATASLLNLACQAQQTQPTHSGSSPERDAWRKSMKRTPLPKKGCFTASYPGTAWQEAPCVSAPNHPYSIAGGSKPAAVGSGVDYTAQSSPSGSLLSSADGSFPSVSGLTSANAYSLQLNTNRFSSTSACSGAEDPGVCQGWEQFIFSESSSTVFIQYQLFDWGTTGTRCPRGWTPYTIEGTSEIACYLNSAAKSVPSQPLANLPYLSLEGQSSGGTDTAILSTPDGNLSAVGQDSVLDLEQGWTAAEFGVFGDLNYSQVNFNSGTTFAVQTSLYSGNTNAPSCPETGTTGETNNLTLAPAGSSQCCPYSGYEPGIQFVESNASGATATCGPNGLSNLAATPYDENVNVTVIGGGEDPTIEYSANLVDSTPGATIYYVLYECGYEEVESGSVSSGGGIFFEQYGGEYNNCSLSGTMYATAPGYLQSSTTGIDF